jgi:hypothetical protein
MKVKATIILTAAQACRIHDRLANLTSFAWWESNYCTPYLTITDNGSFTAVGQSCEKNFCMIEFNTPSSTMWLEIDSKRGALHDEDNSAGAVFALLDLNILEEFEIQEYDSWRRDVKFWECGLCASPELDRQKVVLEDYFRQWKPELWRDHFLAYDPSRKVLVFHTPEEGVEYGKPAVDFLDGVDYRRLAAEGVKL